MSMMTHDQLTEAVLQLEERMRRLEDMVAPGFFLRGIDPALGPDAEVFTANLKGGPGTATQQEIRDVAFQNYEPRIERNCSR